MEVLVEYIFLMLSMDRGVECPMVCIGARQNGHCQRRQMSCVKIQILEDEIKRRLPLVQMKTFGGNGKHLTLI